MIENVDSAQKYASLRARASVSCLLHVAGIRDGVLHGGAGGLLLRGRTARGDRPRHPGRLSQASLKTRPIPHTLRTGQRRRASEADDWRLSYTHFNQLLQILGTTVHVLPTCSAHRRRMETEAMSKQSSLLFGENGRPLR